MQEAVKRIDLNKVKLIDATGVESKLKKTMAPDTFCDTVLLKKVLTPYNPECHYLRNADVKCYKAGNEQKNVLIAWGDFSIPKSFYIESTGHFNAVESNICYNQLVYYLLAECVQHKLLDVLADWDIEEYSRRQLSDFLIVTLSSTFRNPINPNCFTGQIEIEKVHFNKKKTVFVHTRFTFRDEHAGQSDGTVVLAILNGMR